MPRLRRSNGAAAGITRRGRGRGFEYLTATGGRIKDPATLAARIADLAIPPAWRDVWICPDALGHLQATDIDDAGRKQYLYHEAWRTRRDREKHEAMVAFGQALGRLRRRVSRDLRFSPDTLSQERVLACAVRLLDVGSFRIGSEDYARDNESYGLSTLRRDHVTIDGDELVFDFPAKSGQRRVQSIADHDALRVIRALKRRRSGAELLAYREGRGWVDVRAEHVNAYIKQASGGEFSAKDFRTFNATVLTAVELARAPEADSEAARRRVIRAAIATTAEHLGNTPAVCRRSYVDPRVIDRFEAGETIDPTLSGRRQIEAAVLDLLDDSGSQRRAA